MKNIIKKIKNYMSYLPKRTLILALALFGVLSISAATLADFGPDRPTKVYSQGVAGFDYVTFNSFTNVPKFGDERAFYNAQYADQADSFYDPLTQVRNGDELTMHVYIHNGADKSLNASGVGIAKNVNVKVDLPQGVASKVHTSKATITSSNATPQSVFDTLNISAENQGFFELEFVSGSAKLVGNGINQQLSDSLIASGVNIGDINGCFEYAVAVTFKVKVKMPHYQISKEVRKLGETSNDWAETKTVKPGEKVEWLIGFNNVGTTELKDVKIVDNLPNNVEVVSGSLKLINGNYPDGYVFTDGAIQNGGKQINIGIGNYKPGINAYVIFTTIIDKDGSLKCGVHLLTNKAYATPSGFGAISDEASVKVDAGECDEPENPLYSCDLLTATKTGNRSFKFKTSATAENGAQVSRYFYNFGDGTDVFITDSASVDYTYAKVGQYVVSVQVEFNLDGKLKVVDNANCKVIVTTDGETLTIVTPPSGKLPDTGPASMFAALFGTSSVGVALRNWLLSRKALKSPSA